MFDLKGGRIVVDPNKLIIPQFARLWDRDESEDKSLAMKELAYVYYMTDYKSPYKVYDEDLRENHIIEDFMPPGWKPDIHILTAMSKYQQMTRTPSMDLLDAAKEGMKILGDRLKDDKIATKDLLAAMKQLKETVVSYDALKGAVEKEMLNAESRTKGQTTIRDRERVKS